MTTELFAVELPDGTLLSEDSDFDYSIYLNRSEAEAAMYAAGDRFEPISACAVVVRFVREEAIAERSADAARLINAGNDMCNLLKICVMEDVRTAELSIEFRSSWVAARKDQK